METYLRLMIVDDDVDDRTLFVQSVKEIDETIECIVAKDGQEALKLLSQPLFELPNFIFLDLRMPRIGGKRCLIELKKDERLKNIPVVIYTTSREVKESQELKELGAVHFISKPGSPDEIYYVVSFVLDELRHFVRNDSLS
jgi:CheY-like chemotaxis protein